MLKSDEFNQKLFLEGEKFLYIYIYNKKNEIIQKT